MRNSLIPESDASPYISKEEEDFLALCRKKNIECKLQETIDGNRVYAVIFAPEYLDNTEKMVVNYCKENGIKYTFYRDSDGNHHYNFSRLIDMFSGGECNVQLPSSLISFDKILLKHPVPEPEPIKIKPKKWWEKLLFKCGLCRIHLKPTKKKSDDELFIESLGLSQEDLLRLGLPREDD